MTRALLIVCLAVASVASAQVAPGVVGEIRVHGNHTTPDEEVVRPRPWRESNGNANGGSRGKGWGIGRRDNESLDVPAFLRRQMD